LDGNHHQVEWVESSSRKEDVFKKRGLKGGKSARRKMIEKRKKTSLDKQQAGKGGKEFGEKFFD